MDRTATFLRRGAPAILPCDTIYGFVGIAAAAAAIRALKGRDGQVPFLYLIGDESWLPELGALPLPAVLQPYWPGPLTVVLPTTAPGGTVGVRVPDDQFLQAVLTSLGAPLISTSVNRSGQAPLSEISEIVATFGAKVDLIVDAGRLSGLSSTVVDATGSPLRVLRQGGLRLPSTLFAG